MKTKSKIYLNIIIFVAISLCLILFLIYPPLRDIKNNSKAILSNESREALISREITELDNFKKKYNDYENNFKKIDQLFIDPKNPVNFIKFLEELSYGNNIDSDINLISTQANQNNSAPPIAFKISAVGTTSNLVSFIKRLELSSYLVTIINITIKGQEQSNQTEKIISQELVQADFLIEVESRSIN